MRTLAICRNAVVISAAAALLAAAAALSQEPVPEPAAAGVVVLQQEPAPPSDAIAEAMAALRAHSLALDTGALQRAAIAAMVAQADPQGVLLLEQESARLREQEDGCVPAVGIRLSMTNGAPRVAALEPGTAAAECGLALGDTIVTIEDQATMGRPQVELEAMLRGSETQTVHLVARREDGSTSEWEVARSWVHLPSLEGAEMLSKDICYMRLNGLFEHDGAAGVADQVRAWAAEGDFGLILDLRRASGRHVPAAAAIAGLFAEAGSMLLAFRDRDDQDIAVYRAGTGPALAMPVMVLTDRDTRGAAEVLAAVFSGSVRGAMLFGQRSKGDPLVRTEVPLSSGERLRIATRRLVLADGTAYDGSRGVQPDITAGTAPRPGEDYEPSPPGEEPSEQEEEDRRLRERVKGDPVLRRAADVLLGLKALNIGTFGHPTDTAD